MFYLFSSHTVLCSRCRSCPCSVEAPRGDVTCPRSPSSWMMEPAFEPRHPSREPGLPTPSRTHHLDSGRGARASQLCSPAGSSGSRQCGLRPLGDLEPQVQGEARPPCLQTDISEVIRLRIWVANCCYRCLFCGHLGARVQEGRVSECGKEPGG